VTDTQEPTRVTSGTGSQPVGTRRKGASLASMLLPELQQLAASLGINTTKMRKSDLVAAISNRQTTVASADGHATDSVAIPPQALPMDETAVPAVLLAETTAPSAREAPPAAVNGGSDQRTGPEVRPVPADDHARSRASQPGGQPPSGQPAGGASQQSSDREDEGDGSRRRGRRYRDRRGRNRDRSSQSSSGSSPDAEPTVSEDDVLIPVAGILDALEEKNTWFVRTAGYFASPEDIYVANSYVRRFGLRRGDAVTGAIRQPRDGERREKYNPLVRLDTVNGRDPEAAKNRVEFTKLTPLYPQSRLRLETESHVLTTRVIDLVMPIGKGQRALIVSPPKAGKTMVLQAIANAITVNNPECHLMVVLVDERPEEVTDMQRSVKGEVISSTFDRRPQDHTMVAELSIERAKRLVELGHDVVVLLDSITRLGRAYNLAAPASGRILSGGVDSTALYQPKRFLGAARNIENGGSLTIIATALVETGSAGDTVFFEEYKGTGNAELKLDRKIADKRVFPAIDVDQSSTRKEEILLSPDELAVVIKLRRVLHALDPQQAIDLLLDRLKKTRTNVEFLMQIAKTTPGQD
jgi:transcription termination factor Rho